MNKPTDFIVRNRQQIVNHLSLLIKEKSLITLKIDNNQSFITTLIAIDNRSDKLLFDYGPKEYLNKLLPNTPRVLFRTVLSGIKVNFEGKSISKSSYKGEAVFVMPIPDSLLWLQRRQFYRVKSPLSKSSHLKLMNENEAVPLRLYDISISGFSVLSDSDAINRVLSPSLVITDCRLILEEIGENIIEFEVIYHVPLNPDKPDKTIKIGSKFIKVSPSFESCIQRYMQQIEREIRQKLDN